MRKETEIVWDEWIALVRELVKYAEDNKRLGCAEVAKSLLLYGMKIRENAQKADLHPIDTKAFLDELNKRHALVKETCRCDKGLP